MPINKSFPSPLRLGWIEAGSENELHNIGKFDKILVEENWLEYLEICSIMPQFRPRVVDFISAEKEARGLLQSPSEYASELDQTSHPMLIGGLHATLGLAAIQTALTSYLAAASAFIYRAERYLSKIFGGSQSEQFKKFKTATNKEYDSFFAYRLFRNMRNFSQHQAIPVSNIEISAKRDETQKLRFSVGKIVINRLEILQALTEEKKQPKFREELAAAEEDNYDLIDLASQDLECLKRLFFELCTYHVSEFARMAEYEAAIRRILGKADAAQTTPVMFEGDEADHAHPHLFGFDELKYLSTLVLRTGPWDIT